MSWGGVKIGMFQDVEIGSSEPTVNTDSRFPIRIQINETNEKKIIHSSNELPQGINFTVLETRVTRMP